jgi:hypothetical protein
MRWWVSEPKWRHSVGLPRHLINTSDEDLIGVFFDHLPFTDAVSAAAVEQSPNQRVQGTGWRAME